MHALRRLRVYVVGRAHLAEVGRVRLGLPLLEHESLPLLLMKVRQLRRVVRALPHAHLRLSLHGRLRWWPLRLFGLPRRFLLCLLSRFYHAGGRGGRLRHLRLVQLGPRVPRRLAAEGRLTVLLLALAAHLLEEHQLPLILEQHRLELLLARHLWVSINCQSMLPARGAWIERHEVLPERWLLVLQEAGADHLARLGVEVD